MIGGDDASFVRRLLIAAAIVAGALLLWRLRDILLLAFAAILVAVLMRALADPLRHRLGIAEGWSLLLAGALIVLLILGAFGLAGAQLQTQLAQLVDQLPAAWEQLQDRLPGRTLRELEARLEDLPSTGGNVVASFAGLLGTITSGLADLLVVIFAGIFLAIQPGLYRRGVLLLFPKARRDQMGDTLDACGSALHGWLLAQLTCMAVVGTAVGVGLWLIGVPSALALALIAVLLEFIPMVGPVLAAVPALVLAVSLGLTPFLLTLGLYILVQQIESNLLLPTLFRQTVSLPPALTIFAVITFGYLFGIYGLLLAAPLTVVTYVAVRKLYLNDTLGEAVEVPGQH